MKIIISNTVILNGGDAAILTSIIKILQDAFGNETKFVIYDSQPEIASKYYPKLDLRQLIYLQSINSTKIRLPGRIVKWISQIRLKSAAWCLNNKLFRLSKLFTSKIEYESLFDYKSADLIVSTGGTYLVENYDLSPRIFDYQVCLIFGKPLIFFTQSLGPFTEFRTRHVLNSIFARSPLILLRDCQSAKHLQEIGVEQKNLHVVADTAFAIADEQALEAAKTKSDNLPGLKIAISVRDWQYFRTVNPAVGIERYVQALVSLTVHLVENYQASIVYISSCQGITEYWKDDSKFALNILERLPDNIANSVSVNQEFHSPTALIKILREYDLVIATRLHMAILALGVGIPVFPISYEFKTKELFSKLGQEEWMADIENIEATSLIDSVNSFINSVPQIRHNLIAKIRQERSSAWQASALVQKAFKQWQLDN